MSIRLNKAIRELNIGRQMAVGYLQKRTGVLGEVRDDLNFKLNDKQYAALVEAFKKDAEVSGESKKIKSPKPPRATIIGHTAYFNLADTIKWLNISWQDAIGYLYSGESLDDHIYDPSMSIPSNEYKKLTRHFTKKHKSRISDEGKNSVDVFKLKTEKQFQDRNVSVVGKISIDALNTSTRPRKKTNVDRRRERQERSAKYNLTPKENQNSKGFSNNYQLTIRDIWQNFVDIKEKLIKQRCAPISILPESIDIEDDKLYVTVDESHEEQQLDTIFKDKLGLDSYDLESGYILVDEDKWSSLSESDLQQICKELSTCYIELDTTPTINATINYGSGMNRTDQLSLEELHQMESILKNGNLIEGSIDDTAAFISKVSVQREEYMKFLFGDHYKVYEKKSKKDTESKKIDAIEYENQYIPWEVMQQYANIGLLCKQYKIIIKVNDPNAKEELRDYYDCYFPETDTFEFCRTFTKKSPCGPDYIHEVNENIKVFMDDACILCSKNNLEVNVLFSYMVSRHLVVRSKLQEVGLYIASKGAGYSFNTETGAIGIDFNWRAQDINELISDVENAVPFIKINVHDDHRFKCKVNTQLVGYDKLKETLEEKYEDIEVVNDSVFHRINIRLPYIDAAYYDIKRASLENDLLQLSVTGIGVKFADKVKGKVCLNVKYNEQSKLEDLADSISEMRKADFGLKLEDTEIPFGKLLKANFPDLVFDIDIEDEETKDKVIKAFESKAVDTIIPILTGDLEKINRLKNTFTMATTGEKLVNPRLQRFIFDSSEATPTKDIDLLLRRDGTVYKDLVENLLNTHINESQKDAIIKAMFADDLAVIQGPPGTGKSTAIAEMIWQLVRRGLQQGNQRERILLTSETNLAVDNAISRIVNSKTNLVKPIRFGGEEKLEAEGLQFSIELMKRWVEEGDSCLNDSETDEETDTIEKTNLILKNWLHNISERSFYGVKDEENEVITRWRHCLEHPSSELRQIVYNHYVDNANVVGATCSSIGDRRAGNAEFNGFTPFYHNYCEVFKQKMGRAKIEFTTVIQDESSKATPAELVLPFVYGQRAIVIGDHRQLPPMLDKEEFEDSLDYAYNFAREKKDKIEIKRLCDFVDKHFNEMEVSHFQRLYENIDPSLKATFNLQYRMHPDINDVIKQFYREDGGLYCGLTTPIDLGVNDPNMGNPASRYHGIDIPGLIDHNTHVLFIDTDSPEMLDGTSRVNYGEIDVIDKLLTRFEESESFKGYLDKFTKDEDRQIGIISFYGKQIKQLRSVAHDHNKLPIRVSTVDRFQGMERNIVIVSMVRSHIIQSSKDQRPDWKRYPEYGYPKQTSLGFAQSPNRLNVALSRARRLLVIVGNRQLFSTLDIYQRLFMTIDANSNDKVIKQVDL